VLSVRGRSQVCNKYKFLAQGVCNKLMFSAQTMGASASEPFFPPLVLRCFSGLSRRHGLDDESVGPSRGHEVWPRAGGEWPAMPDRVRG